jgi:hypothetical protein
MKNLLWLLLLIPALGMAAEKTFKVNPVRSHHAKGLRRDPIKFKEFKKLKAHRGLKEVSSVPAKWDLTAKVSPPLDQGQCGDCWNFSIFKSFWSEFLLNGYKMEQPAANYLKNNCSGVPAAQEYGCNGGDFPAGEGMLSPASGPWAESQDPYVAQDGSCQQGLKPLGLALTWVVVGDGSNPPSFQDLAMASYNKGMGHMLSVDVDASSGSWAQYQSGIYNENGGCSIDHMIDMVGYDCETSVDANGDCVFNAQGQPVNGDGYEIVENNWGTNSFGFGGYMKTRWGMNCIAQTAMYFEIKPNTPPPPIVNGGWSDWTPCVNNSESRTCTNPMPSNGGSPCIGPAQQSCLPAPLPVPPSQSSIPLWVYLVLGGFTLIIIVLAIFLFRAREAKLGSVKQVG